MQPKTTAKDFFLQLGIIVGLYTSVISFLMLAFAIIDKVFPLVGEYMYYSDSGIRSPLATLVIFFPAFLYVLYLGSKELQANPEKEDVWVRRWGIFLTLFLAGLTIAIDLVTLVYRFLGAEDLNTRFFLKVFVVLVVAIVVFRSSLQDLRRATFVYDMKVKIKVMTVSAVVLAIAIYGFILIGSPAMQRAQMLDETRVNDLSSIQSQIVYAQWQNKGTVPETLNALKDPISGYMVPTDPETKESYEYKKLSKNSFELCATFKTEAGTTTAGKPMSTSYTEGPMMTNENWQHGIGRACFTRSIDQNLYPVKKS